MKNTFAWAAALLLLIQPAAHADSAESRRIAELERKVEILTEQVNRLLAERLDSDSYRSGNRAVYVCRLNAFTDTFRAEDSNRGRARLAVAKQCRQKFDAMFCKEEQTVCETYR